MKLILHIGLEKTGTSAIQDYLSRSKDVLDASSAVYSASAGRPESRNISSYAAGDLAGDHVQRKQGIADEAAYAQFCRRFAEEFRNEARQAKDAGARTFILSDELCHGRLHTAQQVQRLRSLFDGLFETIEILAVLRPQAELAVSLASTAAKNGTAIDERFFDAINDANTYFNYDRVIGLWSAAFGKHAVKLIPFERSGAGVATLLGHFGLTVADGTSLPRRNEALDVRAVAVLNALGQQRLTGDGEQNTSWIGFLTDFPAAQRLTLPRNMMQDITGRFAQSNRSLLKAFPGFPAAALTPDCKFHDERGNLDILQSADHLAPVLRFMTARLATDKTLALARAALLQSRLKAAQRNRAKAQAFAERALRLAKQAAQHGLDRGKAAQIAKAARRAKDVPPRPGLLVRLWQAFRG
jgi:hypothetical protein